jgi:hypothetical protein
MVHVVVRQVHPILVLRKGAPVRMVNCKLHVPLTDGFSLLRLSVLRPTLGSTPWSLSGSVSQHLLGWQRSFHGHLPIGRSQGCCRRQGCLLTLLPLVVYWGEGPRDFSRL